MSQAFFTQTIRQKLLAIGARSVAGTSADDILWPMAILACPSYVGGIRCLRQSKVLYKFSKETHDRQ